MTGQSYLGKRTFLVNKLNSILSEEDIFISESSIDGVREAMEFFYSQPLFSPFKAVVFDGVDHMPEIAQDALLKILEEPASNGRLFLIAEDEGLLQPAIQNRLEGVIHWSSLNDEEMLSFVNYSFSVNEDAIRICRGRPGLYSIFLNDIRYTELHYLCVKICEDENHILHSTPEIILSLKSGPSIERDAVSHVIANAARGLRSALVLSSRTCSFMRLASDLVKIPSINADIHWQRACLHRAV